MVPPSATDGVAVRLTVEVSTVSVTLVTAGVLLTTRFSKLPPDTLVMLALTCPASRYGLSPCVANATLPVVWLAPMVMVWPLLRVTVTGDCAALVRVAVYTIWPPSATLGVADSETEVVSCTSLTVVLTGVLSATRFS